MKPDLAALADAVRAVLPSGLAIGWSDPAAPAEPLWPAEVLPGAVPKRLAEFAAGRAAARRAMASLGVNPQAIPAGSDRAPIWPAGVTGSISHSASACLAIVGRTGDWAGIGLDIEPATPLAPDLCASILRDEEIAMLEPGAGLDAKRIFCVKEAVYKAQYPQSRTLFGFDALSVELDRTTFVATFRRPVAPFRLGQRIAGRHLLAQGHLVALALLAASGRN